MVTDKGGFYTMKGYERSASDEMTSSMEDYLEMVCRMEEEGEPIRVSSLAARKAGYIDFKKYGSIMVTDKGYEEGRYLLHRHRVLQDFFCTLNHTEDELELVEKIEHFINHRTVENMEQALSFLRHKNDMTGKMG